MDSIRERTLFPWDDLKKVIMLSKKKETVYARECEVREVTESDARSFLDTYHLQGYARCSVRLGLYHDGELACLMTFGKPRYSKKADWELIRLCQCKNVIGGVERLLKHFVEGYSPKAIISYCDLSKFDGRTYERLGFTLLRKSAPTRHWYNPTTGEHYTDALIRKHGFSRIVNGIEPSDDDVPTHDNATLMRDAGFVEIYDKGQATYMWTC